MAALSQQIIIEFCKLCDWASQTWLNHRLLFDENPRAAELQASHAGDVLARLNIISREYALLQVAKLHDRAIVAGEITLSIEYVVKYGAWSEPLLVKLEALATQLNGFASKLRTVRNKALSHNDVIAILSNTVLGSFAPREDLAYFASLQEFANLIHEEVIGGPYPFDDLVLNEVQAFLACIRP